VDINQNKWTANEKRKEHNLPLFLLFIDYEKAYDNVNRDELREMMDNRKWTSTRPV